MFGKFEPKINMENHSITLSDFWQVYPDILHIKGYVNKHKIRHDRIEQEKLYF